MTERREAIEAALKLHYGMSPEDGKKLTQFNEAQADWTATCRVCGKKLTGTPQQIRDHALDHQSK